MCNIGVSIICNAYNHEKYIKDALEGFVLQKTTFPIEVLVHDDASTDNTANIIREYEQKYPDIIKPIYQAENQYSKGNGAIGKIQFARAKGKYIAICEGDDYWTDPYKLQKQFDIMEQHPQYTMCAHAANVVEANTKKPIKTISPMIEDGVLSIEDVILHGGGYVVTNSLFYRTELNNSNMEFRKKLVLDYTLQILGAVTGNGILYLSDNMSVYRWLSDGSFTTRVIRNGRKNIRLMEKIIEMLKTLDDETGHKFYGAIKTRILMYEYNILIEKEEYRKLFQRKYFHILAKKPRTEIVKVFIYAYMPFSRKIVHMLKGKR